MRKFIFGTIIITLALFAFTNFSSAQTVEELKTQISNTNTQIEKLNKEIKALSGQIAQTSQQKNTLANAIKDLTLKRNKLVKERESTEKKITAAGLVIKTLSSEIDTKSSILDKSKESLSSLLKNLYQQDGQTFAQKLLAQDNISEMSREYNDIVRLNQELENHIENVTLQKQNLTVSKGKKEEEKQVLNTLKKTLTAKEIEIEENKKEKNTLLKETQNKELNYKKLLAETQKRKDAFEKAIEDYESQIKFILNPKSLPKGGVLSWPLSSITITSQYGDRCLIKLYGKCKFHYGLDFRAPVGTKVMSMGTGTVMGTGDTDVACKGASFGKWVFIKYDNGLSSTYGHLSSISASKGDKVKAGDIVAYSGNTGSSTGPHLHVSVYASDGVKVDTVPSKSCGGKVFTQPISALTAYLNPSLYLPKK